MLNKSLSVLVLTVLLATGSGPSHARDADSTSPAKASGEDVFSLTRVHKMHLEISAEEWEAMQAVVGRGPLGGGRGPQQPGGPQPGGPRSEPQPGQPQPSDRRPPPPGENRPTAPSDASGNNQPVQTAAQPDKRPAELHKSAGFGTEFPWAHGKLEAFGHSFADVGVRYKGNGSYMGSSGSLKRNLKIDLDRYQDDQQFQGIKALNLNAGGVDPTRLREALGFEVFRAAGVPAPRTAFVELTLTVPGKYDHELVGMYTLIEQVDKPFLKDRFGDAGGLLMKPERLRDFAYLGEDWERYTGQYQPKNFPSKKQARRVIEFARLLDKGSDETLQAGIGDYLDVDEFLRFLAVSAWLSNMDSIFATGHNYYIYLDRQSNKLNFLPWDLDLSFAGFPMMGSADDQMNLSLKHPHGGANKLIDRVLAVPEIGRRYDALLAELGGSSFAKDRLLEQIAALEKATAEPRAHEQAAVEARNERRRGGPFGGGGFGGMGRSPALNAYVEKRTEMVAAQLAGKNPGYMPRGGFGPGGRGGFGPGMFMARPLLTALDANKDGKLTKDEWLAATTKSFADADAEKRGKLDEAAITAALEQIIPAPPGSGPPRGGAPGEPAPGERGPRERTPRDSAPRDSAPREQAPQNATPEERPNAAPADRRPEGALPERPPGFSPAARVAAALVKRADTDHDDQVTLDEAMAAAEAMFAEADGDKKLELDENKLAAAINKLFPLPPGIGPPGFGPPGGGPGAGPPAGGPGFGRPGSERRDSDRRDFGFGGPGFGRPGQRSPDPPAGGVPRQPRGGTATLKQTETPRELEASSLELPSANGDLRENGEHSTGKASSNGHACIPIAFAAANGATHGQPDQLSAPAAGDDVDPAAEIPAGGEKIPAFELKFLVDESRAAEVEDWARQHLAGDPHGDPALGGAYHTNSVYCDTPELDVYHRSAWYRRRKFRLRSYGSATDVFLERKTRRGDRVAKRRTSISATELSVLAGPVTEETWPAYWFHRRILKRRLAPACQILYRRTAFVGPNLDEGLRLTLDRDLNGALVDCWSMTTTTAGVPLLAGQVILEFKFRAALPACFKQLIAAMNLNPASVSKYRLCRDAWLATTRAAERRNA